MAIPDYLGNVSPDLPGTWPGASTDAAYINFLKLAYSEEMFLQMQQIRGKAAGTATRQIVLEGYEKRIQRWGKATLQQRTRGALIGDDVGGVASAETPTQTVVIRGVPWEYPEFFDRRDQLGFLGMMNALTSGAYQQNVLASMNRKADSVFFTEIDNTVQVGVENGGTLTYAADGGTTVSARMKQDGTDHATVATSFNQRKALELLANLQANDAFTGPGDNYLALHPIQLKHIFTQASINVTSADFNALRPLMSGEVTQYLGFTWIMSTEIPVIDDVDTTSAGDQAGHAVFAWNRNAVVTGRGREEASVNYIADRTSDLLFHGAFFGAVRVDGLGVSRVLNQDVEVL